MNALKKFSAVLLITGTFLFMSTPKDALGQSADCPFPGCFGGYASGMTYCTCSSYYWMVFAPLYIYGMPTAMAAPMSVPPVVSFMNYTTGPSMWYLGTYIPGVGACYMYAVYGCFELPSFGTVLPYTGTSLPGAF